MKRVLSIIAAIVLLSSFSMPLGSQQEDMVYICTGKMSKRYHCKRDCHGLSSCSGEIQVVTEEYAQELGRTRCGWCYKKHKKQKPHEQ